MEIEFNIELKRFKNEHRLCIDDIFSALVVIVGIIINFVAFSTTWFWFCFYSSPVPCKSQVDAVNQSGRHPPTPIRGDSYMFSLCVFIQQNVFFPFKISNQLNVAVLRVWKCHFSLMFHLKIFYSGQEIEWKHEQYKIFHLEIYLFLWCVIWNVRVWFFCRITLAFL